MQTVGGKLRNVRLEKNISLDEVHRQTMVHTRVLQALEEDRAHNFLSFIYIKGFLKTYAQYLGLDAEKLLKEYIDSHKVEVQPAEIELKKPGRSFPQLNLFLILRIILIIFVSFALIFYFRFILKRISRPDQEVEKQKVRVTVAPAPVVKVKDLVLEVRTKDECWMRVKTDNQVVFQKTLSKGKRELWRAKESLELRIGKPEALEIFLNGKPVDLQKAQVKRTLIITQEGITGR